MQARRVFVSGGTGYMGRAVGPALIARGHAVTMLARSGSERKAPPGARVVTGNALDVATFTEQVQGADTFLHLVGVAHPAPWKEHAFRAIDLASMRASARAAKHQHIAHFVY